MSFSTRDWWYAVVVVLGALGAAVPARAEPPMVSTVVDPCVPVERVQLDKLLAIELGMSVESAGAEPGPTQVHVGCVAEGIELTLEDGVTRKTMRRVLPAESFRDASSTRLLALAIAELTVASWIELRLPQKVEPVGAPPSRVARERSERVVERRAPPSPAEEPTVTDLSLGATVQAWSENDGPLGGGELRVVHSTMPWLAFSLSANLSAAQVRAGLGRVLVRASSASVAALLRAEERSLSFFTGPGVRLGLVQMAGEADDGTLVRSDSFYAPYGGPYWLGRGAWELASPLLVALDLELGITTLPARAIASETPVVSLDGVWFAATLGLGLRL